MVCILLQKTTILWLCINVLAKLAILLVHRSNDAWLQVATVRVLDSTKWIDYCYTLLTSNTCVFHYMSDECYLHYLRMMDYLRLVRQLCFVI